MVQELFLKKVGTLKWKSLVREHFIPLWFYLTAILLIQAKCTFKESTEISLCKYWDLSNKQTNPKLGKKWFKVTYNLSIQKSPLNKFYLILSRFLTLSSKLIQLQMIPGLDNVVYWVNQKFKGQKDYFLLDCSKIEVKNVTKIVSSRLLGMYWIILSRRTYWTQPVQKDGAQWIQINSVGLLKFMFSKKATKIDQIFIIDLTFTK